MFLRILQEHNTASLLPAKFCQASNWPCLYMVSSAYVRFTVVGPPRNDQSQLKDITVIQLDDSSWPCTLERDSTTGSEMSRRYGAPKVTGASKYTFKIPVAMRVPVFQKIFPSALRVEELPGADLPWLIRSRSKRLPNVT